MKKISDELKPIGVQMRNITMFTNDKCTIDFATDQMRGKALQALEQYQPTMKPGPDIWKIKVHNIDTSKPVDETLKNLRSFLKLKPTVLCRHLFTNNTNMDSQTGEL